MACTLCRLDIPGTLCEVCRHLADGGAAQISTTCRECGAPMDAAREGIGYCYVCLALLHNIRKNPWMVQAHIEWQRENLMLARAKRALLGRDGDPER